MSAPEIVGEPGIKQEGSSVICTVTAKNADEKSANWFKDDKAFETPDAYKLSASKAAGGNVTFVCEILVRPTHPCSHIGALALTSAPAPLHRTSTSHSRARTSASFAMPAARTTRRSTSALAVSNKQYYVE